MEQMKIKSRQESDRAWQWDLTRIFPDDGAWRAALERGRRFDALERGFAGRLGQSGQTLLDYMDLQERMQEELSLVMGYASLRADEDTAVAACQDMRSKARALGVDLSAAAAFALPEIMAISDETLEGFYRETPGLEKYRTALEDLRRRRAHILSPREEALLAASHTMAQAPYNVFNLFESADLRFPDAADSQGNLHPVTNGSFVPILRSPDRKLRENAFNGYYDTWLGMRNTAAALLDAQMKQLQFYADARGYSSALEASLDGTNVPVSVYENLLAAVDANLPLLHRYMALRKKRMGLDKLHMYDVYMPLVPDADLSIPYAQACDAVAEALGVLGPDYVSTLRRAMTEGWIDVYENTGKRSGAYSSGMARPHPYILMNYKDNLNSQFTLAHELGHTMHSYLSAQCQPTVYSDYVIFVAEVASTVNEVLLMRHLLGKTTDSRSRAYLINYFLEQFRTTLYRQTMFADFEKQCGEACARGDALTADELNRRYLDLNRRYYGDATEVDGRIAVEWARIPHFYYNYYVFQYATGFSAAVAISDRLLREGKSAVEDYLRFLSSGSSKTPIELLKIAGVDMTTPEPVNAALRLFGDLIGQLEALTEAEA